MPRKKIKLNSPVDSLSILDLNGKVDPKLEPPLADDLLLNLYRAMVLGRRFDERQLSLQRQGRIGTFPPITGQEAAHLGAVAALRASDWMVPSFRETAAELWRGRKMENIIIYNNGYGEGAVIEPERNDLPWSIPVGSQILHAAGLAWAIKYRQKDDVAMTFFGDGATSEGDFHEGMNMAAVFQIPAIFVCQNNQWAISIPRAKQTRAKTLAQKAVAYEMPGIQVDGNDILAVYVAAQEAVTRARNGDGPTFIECVTYRMMMHTTADDPKRYRTDEEVAYWQKRDPLSRFEKYLTAKKLLDKTAIEQIEADVQTEIQQSVDAAEAKMKTLGDPMDMFDHAYADMPPNLVAQKKMLAQDLAERAKEAPHG